MTTQGFIKQHLLLFKSSSSSLSLSACLCFLIMFRFHLMEVFISTISVSQALWGMSLILLRVWPGHLSDQYCVPQPLLVRLPFTLGAHFHVSMTWARCCEASRPRTLILITELRQPSLGYFTIKEHPCIGPICWLKMANYLPFQRMNLIASEKGSTRTTVFSLQLQGVSSIPSCPICTCSLGECSRNWQGTHQTPDSRLQTCLQPPLGQQRNWCNSCLLCQNCMEQSLVPKVFF